MIHGCYVSEDNNICVFVLTYRRLHPNTTAEFEIQVRHRLLTIIHHKFSHDTLLSRIKKPIDIEYIPRNSTDCADKAASNSVSSIVYSPTFKVIFTYYNSDLHNFFLCLKYQLDALMFLAVFNVSFLGFLRMTRAHCSHRNVESNFIHL